MADDLEKLPDLWTVRDYPVLIAAGRLTADSTRPVTTRQIATEADLELPRVIKAVKALSDDGLLIAHDAGTYGGPDFLVSDLTGDGRRAVGQWPSDAAAAERILQALDSLIERDETDEATRGWLVKARDALTSAGRDILVQVGGAAIKGSLGV